METCTAFVKEIIIQEKLKKDALNKGELHLRPVGKEIFDNYITHHGIMWSCDVWKNSKRHFSINCDISQKFNVTSVGLLKSRINTHGITSLIQ